MKRHNIIILIGAGVIMTAIGANGVYKNYKKLTKIPAPIIKENNIISNMDKEKNSWLSDECKARAEALISVFENSTPEMQYDYAEYLDDGRGITAGRAGFTTGTGDAYEVVKKYTQIKPKNPLAKYLPELTHLLTAENKDDVSGLVDYEKAWTQTTTDDDFKQAQDEVANEMYYRPSQEKADQIGLKYNLSRAQIYDTCIMHGDGDDQDSLSAIIKRTNEKSGGAPIDGVDEKIWLANFLAERKNNLKNPYNQDTQEEWSEATDRVLVFENLAKENNWDLAGPIKIDVPDWQLTIN